MSKRVIHLYNNPRNGLNTCVSRIDPEELYRWEPYAWSWDKTKSKGPVTCKRCLKHINKRK